MARGSVLGPMRACLLASLLSPSLASAAASGSEPRRAEPAESGGGASASNPSLDASKSRSEAAIRTVDDRRPVPDFDGREEARSLGSALLWVPRIALFPAYLVSEYLVRRPLGWLVSTAEREKWPAIFLDYFTFGDRTGGILPTFMIDFGMRPSVGAYAFWNDFLVQDNDLRLRLAYGGEDLYLLNFADRFPIAGAQASLRGRIDSRPDNPFSGIGRGVRLDERSRFYRHTASVGLFAEVPWFRRSSGRLSVAFRRSELDGKGRCCGDPSLDESIAEGELVAPPGMGQVYVTLDQRAEVAFDSRYPRFPDTDELASDYLAPPGTGVRLALRGGISSVASQTVSLSEPLANNWVSYGASLGGFWDLTGYQRALSITAIVDFVDPVGSGTVPLTDLVSLGGARPLRAFLANQFVDRSAAVLRIEYIWPVAVWLEGTATYEVGQVFGAGLSGFSISSMRASYGMGMQAMDDSDHAFQVLVALGTEQFNQGGAVDSLRLVLGTTAGF